MILPALTIALGLIAGFLLIRHIPPCPPAEARSQESVSIIIPARNEEKTLPRLLRSIIDSATRPLEVVVVDDGSTDHTAEVAASLGAHVFPSVERPAGWTGKSWACYQGAQCATGEVLLFLDADTYFLPGGLERLVSCWSWQRDRRLVLSVLPYHATNAACEQLSLFFNVLMAAGAGGFGPLSTPRLFGQSLCISKDTYFAAGGHAAVRGIVLENLRWASKLRDCGARIICLGGKDTLHTRMFPDGFQQMSESWAKAFFQGAADSGHMVLFMAIAWISALWSAAALLIIPSNYGQARSGRPIHSFEYADRLDDSPAWQLPGFYLSALSATTCLLLHYLCAAAARHALGRKAMWRGRQV